VLKKLLDQKAEKYTAYKKNNAKLESQIKDYNK
jgi:hypothetical protein